MFALAVSAAAGCSGSSAAVATKQVVDGRFTVVYSAAALRHAEAAGINLQDVVAHTLNHIDALLPGPKTTIHVDYSSAVYLIPQLGVAGVTSPNTGQVIVAFGTTPEASIKKAMALWFPRDLAHEVTHSVRVLAGPGVGITLLEGIIAEGIATTFDQVAFAGPLDPWADAITPQQECRLWRTAQPLLDDAGLYRQWMFGGQGVPHWTAFTIGYHIVRDYRARHPTVTWDELASTSTAAILAGSGYQPCSR